ncbi:hypothetical protein [Amycolatopsis sp. NBC_01480]|uniref:hypothetical protein n=1 Tax=Amycolatopsis sp. NBC_01480 TaxID=2903562 RepID=UPI002E2CF945|nr:hypothetical protein [Amycolatopsis sp. NBC_01480]
MDDGELGHLGRSVTNGEASSDLCPGTGVTYTAGGRRDDVPARRHGTVAGRVLHDRFLNTSWVPIRPDRSADDIPPQWVRSRDIVAVDQWPHT